MPAPEVLDYPGLLDLPRARIRAYRPETSIAEKTEAMVRLAVHLSVTGSTAQHMLLTIRTTYQPATDLRFLLHEHPEHVHGGSSRSAHLMFGNALRIRSAICWASVMECLSAGSPELASLGSASIVNCVTRGGRGQRTGHRNGASGRSRERVTV